MNQPRYKLQAQQALEQITAAGARGEVRIVAGEEFGAEAHNGKVRETSASASVGLSVRVVLDDGRIASASTNDLTPEGIRLVCDRALAAAEYGSADSFIEVRGAQEFPALAGLSAKSTMTPGQMTALAEKVDAEVAAQTGASEGTQVSADTTWHELHTSEGFSGAYEESSAIVIAQAIARSENEASSGSGYSLTKSPQTLDSAAAIREAVEEAESQLNAQPVSTRDCAVVLDRGAAASFIRVVASACCADAVQAGESFFGGKLGQRVAATALTLSDDALDISGSSARPFDGEGTPSQRTTMIEKGELRSYLHNLKTAAKDGTRSTANGAWTSGSPAVSTSNLVVTPGRRSRDRLIAAASGGVLVTDLMGLPSINQVTGQFSLGIRGNLINADGSIGAPIREMTIAGTVSELLNKVAEVGNDARMDFNVSTPSLRLKSMTLAGRQGIQ